jgi:hypothetical protein
MLTAYFSSSGVPITRIYFASFRSSSITPLSLRGPTFNEASHGLQGDNEKRPFYARRWPFRLRFEKIRNLSWLSYDLQLRNRQTSWNFVNSGGIGSETKTEVCPRIGGPRMFGAYRTAKEPVARRKALLGIVSLATSPALKRSMVGGSAAVRSDPLLGPGLFGVPVVALAERPGV